MASATISSVAAISKLSGTRQLGLEPAHVVVADVAAILAQVGGDAVGAGLDGEMCRAHGIGHGPAARVAHRGDVVDVDAPVSACSSVHHRSTLLMIGRARQLPRRSCRDA